MWDDPIPFADEEVELSVEPETQAPVTWTAGQLERIENEWHRAQRSFAYHPAIGIAPLRGDPPHEYQISYRLRTLVLDEEGTLQFVDEVPMHMWLPPGFPNQAPVVRPMAGVFHPNIGPEGIYLSRPWQPTDTLVDLVARVGELLAFRSYDPDMVVNSVALDWMSENGAMLPLDHRADFSPYAGGEPLGRIGHLGPATLDQIRGALNTMRLALMAEEGAPTAHEVEEFARQTRAAASLFLDSDIPDTLRTQAIEFDDWCRELPLSTPAWEHLREQRAHSKAAEFAVENVRNAAAALTVTLNELQNLVPDGAIDSPAMLATVLPEMDRLQPVQMRLPQLVRDFEAWVAELRNERDALGHARPDVAIDSEGSLGRRLATQSQIVAETVSKAQSLAEATLAEVEPMVRRAQPEIQALEQAAAWREYTDMLALAADVEKEVMDGGSEGVHAWFVNNSSGTFGPFQFEEPIDLGGPRVVIRNLQGTQIDVIDAAGYNLLGRATTGAISIQIAFGGASPNRNMTFRLSSRCDDLAVRFDYINKQSQELLNQLKRPVQDATSWCGVLSRFISSDEERKNLKDAHRTLSMRWRAIMTDLAHLLIFKERLATYHLISRAAGDVPTFLEMIAKAKTALRESTKKISETMSKCSRDPATEQVIVPPKLAPAYKEDLRNRDNAKQEIARVEALLKLIGRELNYRVSNSKLCGRPEVPTFRAMPPIPSPIVLLQSAMSDDALAKAVAELGKAMNVPLSFNASTPATITGTRPATPM